MEIITYLIQIFIYTHNLIKLKLMRDNGVVITHILEL